MKNVKSYRTMSRRDASFRVMVNIAQFRTFYAIAVRSFSQIKRG
jgi:hypothetical protein